MRDLDRDPIYHLALRADWERARVAGEYRISTLGAGLDEVGFVHCSFADQLVAVAAAFYGEVTEQLVLLEVDPARVGCPVRIEPAGGADGFPHVYGPLPVPAVRRALDVPTGPTGPDLPPLP